ncbi:MAG TPA: alanyl-tRNA editing protein [Vicinamibacteria bacterium]|nr:alanyl-tRNA editing protein [Vicinamibacteria bacterium]
MSGTVLLYRDDPYLLDFEAQVVERLTHEGQPALVLDRTAFYAESGGQPWDTGTLGDVRVLRVIEHGGRILHVVDRQPAAETLRGLVDAQRRRDHMQQHHGQHLLSRAFVDTAGAPTVSFHLGADESSIDLDRLVADAQIRAAEDRANRVVAESRPVSVRTVPRGDAAALGVRVPDGAGDAVRIVDAEGFDRQACSGTHPARTSEVGVVLVLGHERYKGGTRVRFVCGDRARQAMHARIGVLDRMAQAMSAPWTELPDQAARAIEEKAALAKRNEELRERALAGEAYLLLAQHPESPAIVRAVFEGRDGAEVRGLAEQIVKVRPAVALLASRGAKVQLVFARSTGLAPDMNALLKSVLTPHGGRGGGRPEMAQGGCDSIPDLEALLERLASELGQSRLE